MELCWKDGKVAPVDQVGIHPMDHGLLYGDGVFEGLRFRHGRVFRMEAGLARLFRSAKAISLEVPLALSGVVCALDELINNYKSATGKDFGYIRLVVTRGPGKLGLDPSTCPRPNLFIIAGELSMANASVRANGARLIIASTRKPGPDVIDQRIKSLNYLHNIMARVEAAAAGADEAVMLNQAGYVAEGTAESVFIVRNGELLTPPVEDGALEGVTRGAVMEIAASLGTVARAQRLAPYDLFTADEMFLTGTGMGMLPVGQISGRKIKSCPGPVFSAILQGFEALVERETGATAPAGA